MILTTLINFSTNYLSLALLCVSICKSLVVGISAVEYSSSVSVSQYQALYDLYKWTTGDAWIFRNATIYGPYWNFSVPQDPCNPAWQGLHCTCQSITGSYVCDITAINLDHYNLRGSLPPTLSNFTVLELFNASRNAISALPIYWNAPHLKVLDLSDNFIEDSIPLYFSSMVKLERLDLAKNFLYAGLEYLEPLSELRLLKLSRNFFRSEFPPSIVGLKKLATLEMDSNQFFGTLPFSSTNFQELVRFKADSNHFGGAVPELSCNFLEELYLTNNNFDDHIPEWVFRCENLLILNLDINQFHGPLPHIEPINSKLKVFKVTKNLLTGAIPLGFYNLTALEDASFAYNIFNGSISDHIGQWQNLTRIDFSDNLLHRSIPESFYSLRLLRNLILAGNDMTGTISPMVENLAKLELFDVSYNYFNGSLPDTFGTLSMIKRISASGNLLTSSLPSSIGNLTQLLNFECSYNNLIGSVPKSFHRLRNLRVFNVEENYFTGRPYAVLSAMVNLNVLILDSNIFSGAPPYNSEWRELERYQLYSNLFTGLIPLKRAQSNYLVFVDFGFNLFTGTIGSWIGAPFIRTAYANVNYLHGTIPKISKTLRSLWLDANLLSGSLPVDIGKCKHMRILRMDDNQLSGSLPSDVADLTEVETFFIQFNSFTGKLDYLFAPYGSSSIQRLNIASNGFSGTLPGHIFNSSKLEYFAADSNCLSGTLTENICSANMLKYLSLDGLSTSPSCRIPLFPGLKHIHSFIQKVTIVGTLPQCIFEMMNLQSMYISGNSLTGTISDDIMVSPTLMNISISNNQFSGSLSMGLQMRAFENLDISYNKFFGTVMINSEYIYTNGSFQAQRNRLSGKIPMNLKNAKDINILDGNLFYCDWSRSDLPANDPKLDTYSCGSQAVDIALLLWTVVCPIILLVLIRYFVIFSQQEPEVIAEQQKSQSTDDTSTAKNSLFSYWKERFSRVYGVIQKWRAANYYEKRYADGGRETLPLFTALHIMRRLSFAMTAICVCVCAPVFWILSHNYNSYSYEYAWSVSILIKSGRVPSIIFIILAAIVYVIVWVLLRRGRRHTSMALDFVSHGEWTQVFFYVTFFSIDVFIMFFVNIAYIYAINNSSPAVIFFAEASVALVKVAWNEFLVLRLFGRAKDAFFRYVLLWEFSEQRNLPTLYDFIVQNCLIILNLIVLPILAILFASSNCFYNVLVPPSTDSGGIPQNCDFTINVGGRDVCLRTSSSQSIPYQAPFVYSFQCSSFIVISYAAVYVYFMIIVSLIIPSLKLFLRWRIDHMPTESPWRALYISFLPRMIRPLSTTKSRFSSRIRSIRLDKEDTTGNSEEDQRPRSSRPLSLRLAPFLPHFATSSYPAHSDEATDESSVSGLDTATVPSTGRVRSMSRPISWRFNSRNRSSSTADSTASFLSRVTSFDYADSDSAPSNKRKREKPILDKTILPVRLNSYLSLLLIFGVCFPPMAIPIFLGILVVLYFEELLLGKFLYEAEQAGHFHYKELVRRENREAVEYLTHPLLLWFLLTSVGIIYAFLVYDMWGGIRHGSRGTAAGLAALVLCFPSLIFVLHPILRDASKYFAPDTRKESTVTTGPLNISPSTDENRDVEMIGRR